MSSFYKRYESKLLDELLRCLAALLIPFELIESATNNFADENLIAQRPSGKFYRGKLLQSDHQMVDILVREFQMIADDNVSDKIIVFLLKHKNINPILHVAGYNNRLFVVNKFEPNGSLAKHLPAGSTLTWTQRLKYIHLPAGSTLTWTQRLIICIGVAHALKYIHYSEFVEPDYYVIHGNIKSSKILLDENWQPRLQGFECAMVAERNTLYVTGEYKGTLQYKDPAYEYTGGLTHKSDVFSFGVVLFEVLFGRKASSSSSTPDEQVDNWNFAEFARLHWKNKTLDERIDPDLRKTMDSKSVENFSDVAYQCLKERREERPNMEQVVKALELSLKLQKNHEQHSLVLVKQTSSSDLQGESFEHLMIPLKDIISATENFNVEYQIGSGGFGMVYRAKLELFDSRNSSALEGGDDGDDIRKICSTVAIKRIFRREDGIGEQGFIAEVKMLSNCKHPNIVSLLGFCAEGPQKILIYEYVPNGSLDSYLEQSYRMINLTWSRRIQICLDIAHGLDYLHSGLNGNEIILHRDIKSANILLDNNFRAKIADFGLSRLYTLNPNMSTVNTGNLAGTSIYLDPEYMKTGKLKRASDIYSFGVVLFEILSGTLAYDEIHNTESEKGLPSRARRLSKEGSLKDIVDSNINETDGSILSQNRRADQNSLDKFLNIAIQCLAETQDERPKVEDVIRELESALNIQKNNKDNLEILLEDINLATQNFSDCNCIGEGKLWKLYKGEVPQAISNAKGCTAIVAKRWSKSGQGRHQQFFGELDFVFKHKHKNVIDLVGYCTKMEEKIIVYEHSNRSLDKHLKDVSLTWIERLKISIDVASGLEFLHSGGAPQETVMMHGDIKSGSILVDGEWKAKISNLELITTDTFHQNMESVGVDDHFLDQSIVERGTLSKEYDIYSLGVLLFEVLSGRKEECEEPLGALAIRWRRERKLYELVFEGIKDQIDPFSFDVFTSTAYSCFMTTLHGQPEASDLVRRLEEALEYQKYVEESPKVSLSDINLASDKCIQEGRYWKLYEVQIPHANANGWTTVYAKWWDNKSRQAHDLFFTELRILLKSKNKHIVAFVGYCNEMNEKIIFYEHASNGSLDKHLDNASLTWTKRLNICIEVAKGLQYLHESDVINKISMKHGTMKSGSILIDGDWKVKIANLEFYPSTWLSEEVFDYGYGSLGYIEYNGDHQSTTYVDVYALGVVLLEMFCGRLAWPEGCEDQSHSLGPLAQRHYNEKGNLDELLFHVIIKEQIAPESLTAFQSIAIQCLETGVVRPKAREVVKRLETALDLQRYVEESPQISLEGIKQGTQKFSDDKCVGKGRYWKLYQGEFPDANADGYTTALVKRWDSKSIEARYEFFAELRNLFLYKDDGIIAVEGYCNEMDEKIIVYEHGYNRSLDKHLDDASLRWNKRLKICLDVALAVRRLYLKNNITHGDIRSGSIQIDGDWNAKVSNFELGHVDRRPSYLAQKDSLHELGVVLLEILCGRLDRGEGCVDRSPSLQSLVERHYKEKGNFDELVFEGIKEQIAPESLTIFQALVLKCLEQIPAIEVEFRLEEALEEQQYVEDRPQLSLEDIKLATQNFSNDKCVMESRYWKVYEGRFPHANANGYTSTALVKRWDSKSSQGRQQFFGELKIHFENVKKEFIIAVEGYCSEVDEKIIVYEHGYNRSLDKHLDDTSLSWTKRLNICIRIASALHLFQGTDPRRPPLMTHNIVIDGDWSAKVSNIEFMANNQEWVPDINAHSSLGYVDPRYEGEGMLKYTYAFGVVLLELLCGRLAWPEGCEDHSQSLGPLAKRRYKEKGNLDELVFEGIKEQIAPKSLTTFQEIALKCLEDRRINQPETRMVVKQLQNALELQGDNHIWNLKVPKDYKKIFQMSETPEIYTSKVKKDIYDMLTKGILLQRGKLFFTLGANGERNEMISARKFSYKNRPLRIWRSIPESRFKKVAQIFDISNLKIQIKIKTQLLSPGVKYGVYLVFKFDGSRKSAAKRVYVNLSYKMGKENSHAYFATWRDDEWMMIELCRFSNDKKDVNFEALLQSFSRCYCGSRTVYVEGIEFRCIDNVNYEEIEKSKDVQQVLKSCSNIDEVQQSSIESQEIFKISGNDEGDKMFSVNKVNGKKHFTLTPMEFLYDSSNVKPFDLNPTSVKRSQEVELLPQQVLGIKCKIESQMLSPATNYMCYLVFKFSEKCDGLHGPVIIRDLLSWKSKETGDLLHRKSKETRDLLHRKRKESGALYFRSPSPCNLHDIDWVPRERKDGRMEVTVWKFNSSSELRNDCIPMNLKLITYEGTMSGLIVCSLEIRPI